MIGRRLSPWFRSVLVPAVAALLATVAAAGGLAGRVSAAGPEKPATARLFGVVVDEAGRPVAGADVRAQPFSRWDVGGVTDDRGRFTITVPARSLNWVSVTASADGRRLLGSAELSRGHPQQTGDRDPRQTGDLEVRLVLKPSREVRVSVTDLRGGPAAGAAVEALGIVGPVLDAATADAAGLARLRLPADIKFVTIIALKSGLGFDYYQHNPGVVGGQAADLPDAVALKLDGARTVRVRAVDSAGKPLAGVTFYPWLIQKPGKARRASLDVSRAVSRTTGADGFATFDWLPREAVATIPIMSTAEGYKAPVRPQLEIDAPEGDLSATFYRTETIRGRVTRPDGAPAPGVLIEASGTGEGLDARCQVSVRTGADGAYDLTVDSELLYAVAVNDPEWAAPTRLDLAVLEGWPAVVDFRLRRGTVIRGRVTVGEDRKPAPGLHVSADQGGNRIMVSAVTDADGRYALRVGPGTFSLRGPQRRQNENLVVTDQAEVVRDFNDFIPPRPGFGQFRGRVVHADDPTAGVAGARVLGVAADMPGGSDMDAVTDADGRFLGHRRLSRMVVRAETPGGLLAGIITIGPDDAEAVIPIRPTTFAAGRVVDEQGNPAVNETLHWGRRVHSGDENSSFSDRFVAPAATDGQGRFLLPGLVLGQKYHVSVSREDLSMTPPQRLYHAVAVVTPVSGAPIDLGDCKVGADLEPPTFAKGATKPGATAPPVTAVTLDGRPLTLTEYRGKPVLLVFWATWSDASLAEIPNLLALAADPRAAGRLAVVGLSLDDALAAPQVFGRTHQFPGTQAYLGGGGVLGDVARSYGLGALPALVLVGPDGKVVARGASVAKIKTSLDDVLEVQ